MIRKLRDLWKDERGAYVSEFTIITALVCTAAFAAITILAPHIKNAYQGIANTLN